ncbi:hypothetical protein BH10PSE17_BH10PSE17_10630 [soil metagenome]
MSSWLTLLKAIPMADLIEAAPLVVKGTRRLINSVGRKKAEGTAPVAPVDRQASADEQLAAVQAELADTLRLVESLAEQHQKTVLALDLLQARQRVLGRWLLASSAALAATLATVVWLLVR